MQGVKVGHIKKGQASVLAPLLDQMTNITVEATIPSPANHSSVSVTVNLITKSHRPLSNFELEPIYKTIKSRLSHHFHKAKKTPIANLSRVTPSPPSDLSRAPLQALTTGLANIAKAMASGQDKAMADNMDSPVRATSIQALTAGLTNDSALEVEMTTANWEEASQQLDAMFDEQTKNRLAQLPNYDMPPQFQNLELYDYQKDGIRWLIHQERNDSALPPFVKEIFELGRKRWRCTITRAIFLKPPKPICGGVLADGT
jgi:hypothetical protein